MENEVQIKDIFTNLLNGFKGFLSFLSGFIRFLFIRFYIALPLIILAAVTGYYIDTLRVPNKTASIIVSQNFDSVNYLYESINTIHEFTEAKDQESLEKIGLKGLTNIEIKPIVDINMLFNGSLDTRNLEALFNEVPVDKNDKDGTTLTSQAFKNSYKKHEILIQASEGTKDKIISNFTELLNNNSYYNTLKEQYLINMNKEIKDNELIVNQIDSLIKKSYNKPLTTNEVIAAQLTDSDLNSLINTKKGLVDKMRKLNIDIILTQNTFMVLNKPTFSPKKIRIREKSIVLLPFLSMILLFATYIFIKLYRK